MEADALANKDMNNARRRVEQPILRGEMVMLGRMHYAYRADGGLAVSATGFRDALMLSKFLRNVGAASPIPRHISDARFTSAVAERTSLHLHCAVSLYTAAL